MHSGVCCFSDKQHINGLREVCMVTTTTAAGVSCPRPSLASATLDRHACMCTSACTNWATHLLLPLLCASSTS